MCHTDCRGDDSGGEDGGRGGDGVGGGGGNGGDDPGSSSLNWCMCGQCQVVPTAIECVCCMKKDSLTMKNSVMHVTTELTL